jgi:predicted glycogen debranching enzyme
MRNLEWVETDGLGGYACGPVDGPRTRRYHALLVTALQPPAGRFVLVNGLDAEVRTPDGSFALTTQAYGPGVPGAGVEHPVAARTIESFSPEPWPRWTYRLPDGTLVEHELLMAAGSSVVAMSWRLVEPKPDVILLVRPYLSGRDHHALHHENAELRFDAVGNGNGDAVIWQPYGALPHVRATSNGWYLHEPHWYRGFVYAEEHARGYDSSEDLASPGQFRFDLGAGEAVLFLSAGGDALERPAPVEMEALRRAEERRRSGLGTPLERAGDAYVVQRGDGRTIVAGYPWFADWGRDTFIAMRGLCLATGRLDDARRILLTWAGAVSEGMLPNRFPDGGGDPEYNSVDASLWFVVAARELLAQARSAGQGLEGGDACAIEGAMRAILDGYARGTRHGIRVDDDGLLAAGEVGWQLTWMDARSEGREVTPRIGKPVEVQALWLNALRAGGALSSRYRGMLRRGLASFGQRFWNDERGCLYDVIDVDHAPGAVDATMRPNQVLAVGGLPLPLLALHRARRVVDAVERDLLTPMGLRSLAPDEAAYVPRYEGGEAARDRAYHQGTVWPWLLGPFVEAWVRVRGGGDAVKREARTRFVAPLLAHLGDAGLGHVSEIADGAAPHAPRGCPFQAWSLGELLRLERVVLAPGESITPAHDVGDPSDDEPARGRAATASARRMTVEARR